MIPCDPEYGHLSVLRHRHRPIADLFSALHLPLAPMLQFSVHEQYFGVVSNFNNNNNNNNIYFLILRNLTCQYMIDCA